MDVTKAIERLREAGYYAHYAMGIIEISDKDDHTFVRCLGVNKVTHTVLPSEVLRLIERKAENEDDGA